MVDVGSLQTLMARFRFMIFQLLACIPCLPLMLFLPLCFVPFQENELRRRDVARGPPSTTSSASGASEGASAAGPPQSRGAPALQTETVADRRAEERGSALWRLLALVGVLYSQCWGAFASLRNVFGRALHQGHAFVCEERT